MGDFVAVEHSAENLARLDGRRADEHRLPALVRGLDFLDCRLVLFAARLVYDVVFVDSAAWLVRGNRHDVEPVDVVEFLRLRLGGAGHAREFFVQGGNSFVW